MWALVLDLACVVAVAGPFLALGCFWLARGISAAIDWLTNDHPTVMDLEANRDSR